jgi:hypothetical protein
VCAAAQKRQVQHTAGSWSACAWRAKVAMCVDVRVCVGYLWGFRLGEAVDRGSGVQDGSDGGVCVMI